jgi:hypothetical protein
LNDQPEGEAMSFTQISTNHAPQFPGMEAEGIGAPPCHAPVKSARSRNRAAWWRQDLDRTAAYLMGLSIGVQN